MIVVGVDPGARTTGVAVVSLLRPTAVDDRSIGHLPPRLLGSVAVHRDQAEPLLEVSPRYLQLVTGAILDAVRKWDADLVAVERVTRPAWRVAGKVKPLDPTAIMATAVVLGAVLGRSWEPAQLVAVAVGHNGSRPMTTYPAALRPTRGRGAGHDALRHERSAYDAATRAPFAAAIAVKRRTIYA